LFGIPENSCFFDLPEGWRQIKIGARSTLVIHNNMKYLASLIMSVALASSAFAGPVTYDKAPKGVAPVAPLGCECFAPGFAVGAFAGGLMVDGAGDEDNVLGGGVLAEYFFNQYVGIQGSYGVFATGAEHHEFNGALVLRYPITSLCVAPYVLAGGGYSVNSDDKSSYFVGAGIEARFESLNCLGIFADGAYHFAEDSADEDYTIVRLGVKLPF
jgi:hypothetical protein